MLKLKSKNIRSSDGIKFQKAVTPSKADVHEVELSVRKDRALKPTVHYSRKFFNGVRNLYE